MQNFALLRALGKARKPVLLKRGLAATIDEWLLAAEYLLAGGNDRSSSASAASAPSRPPPATRSTSPRCAWSKQRTHLPVIVDPSHATGQPRAGDSDGAGGGGGGRGRAAGRGAPAARAGAVRRRAGADARRRCPRADAAAAGPVLHAVGRELWRPAQRRRRGGLDERGSPADVLLDRAPRYDVDQRGALARRAPAVATRGGAHRAGGAGAAGARLRHRHG